jgi:hypothetical protein
MSDFAIKARQSVGINKGVVAGMSRQQLLKEN